MEIIWPVGHTEVTVMEMKDLKQPACFSSRVFFLDMQATLSFLGVLLFKEGFWCEGDSNLRLLCSRFGLEKDSDHLENVTIMQTYEKTDKSFSFESLHHCFTVAWLTVVITVVLIWLVYSVKPWHIGAEQIKKKTWHLLQVLMNHNNTQVKRKPTAHTWGLCATVVCLFFII